MIGLAVVGQLAQLEPARTHVADVEQARVGPGPLVLGQHAAAGARILHGHVVAGEGDHAAAALQVRGVERRALEDFGHGCNPGCGASTTAPAKAGEA